MPAEMPPRFLADRMVGKLAKWLRILGYDTVYMPEVSPTRVKREARRQDRILLTRRTCFLHQKTFLGLCSFVPTVFGSNSNRSAPICNSRSRPLCSGGATCATGNWKQLSVSGFKTVCRRMCGRRKRPFSPAANVGASIGTPPTGSTSSKNCNTWGLGKSCRKRLEVSPSGCSGTARAVCVGALLLGSNTTM